MRTCPTCGEYYEDGPLAFCLADGTPLADVDPSGEKWDEAARAVREKAEKLSRRGRRLKWRRVAVWVVATLMTTVVVCVVVINSVRVSVSDPSPPPATPADSVATTGDSGDGDDENGNGGSDGNVNVNVNGNRNGNVNRNGNSNRNSNRNTNGNINRNGNVNRNGNANRNNNVGGGNDNSARCSAADKGREWEAILGSCRVIWQAAIEGERPQIANEFARRGVEPRLGRINYAPPVFSDDCKRASVTASYTWHLTSPTGDVPVPRTKPFACRKTGRVWSCG